ncbi:hypothetical protein K7X08_022892 [Anisodus acutangulus]|uniref:Uncharacterized protein n=1 Tax=Anisodus acutangulus TaxID=402998 RepID=A0A9Q1MET1_9SOLA|nr:hypothetical protein K7X08_022892 [Anisodus acutangulus]
MLAPMVSNSESLGFGLLIFCTLLELGRVLFIISISTVKVLPTADAIEKIASFAKRKVGGRSGKLIHATATEVSSCGLN